jgi:hypothetical protein
VSTPRILFITVLSLRDLSERLCLTGASRESIRTWFTDTLPSSGHPEGKLEAFLGSLSHPEGSWYQNEKTVIKACDAIPRL